MCAYCTSGRENLCPNARFTGCQLDGGYAEYAVADANYVVQNSGRLRRRRGCAAPVRRPHRLSRVPYDRRRRAHWSVRIWRGRAHHRAGRCLRGASSVRIHASGRRRRAGVCAGSAALSGLAGRPRHPPEPLDAAIMFAPVGALVPEALCRVAAGGHRRLRRHSHERHPRRFRIVCCGRSVRFGPWRTSRGRTRSEFLALAARLPIKTRVRSYPLGDANRALADVRAGAVEGAAVLVP